MHLSTSELDFLVEYIVESDAIEGITRTKSDVRQQLESQHPRGHVGAYIYLMDEMTRGASISEEIILNVQALIVNEQEEFGVPPLPTSQIGKWRTIEVSVGGRICPHHSIVPKAMSEWVEKVQEWQRKSCGKFSAYQNMCFMAFAHYAYLHVHPFADGNGRSSRAIAYALFKHAEVPPILFTSKDRHATYYRCFDDPEDMVRYFLMRTH